MILFHSESDQENKEAEGETTPLVKSLLKAGSLQAQKLKEVGSNWPSQIQLNTVLTECFKIEQETLVCEPRGFHGWIAAKSNQFWSELTANFTIKEEAQMRREVALRHIELLIQKTLELEAYYLALPEIGQKIWEGANQQQKALTDERSRATLTEEHARPIPDWAKGIILHRAGHPQKPQGMPELTELKNAMRWVNKDHLPGKNLEETIEVFKALKEKRTQEGTQLQIEETSLEELPEEISEIRYSSPIPYGLLGISPSLGNTTIREFCQGILNQKNFQELAEQFQKTEMFRDWCASVMKRGYLREWDTGENVAERWRTKSLIYNPLDDYVNSRVEKPHATARLFIKTKSAWKLIHKPEENPLVQ